MNGLQGYGDSVWQSLFGHFSPQYTVPARAKMSLKGHKPDKKVKNSFSSLDFRLKRVYSDAGALIFFEASCMRFQGCS